MADGSVLFIHETYHKSDYPPEGAQAYDGVTRSNNIYYLGTVKPSGYATSYWVTAFGGNFDDIPNTSSVQVILDQYLQQMDTYADILATANSYWIDTGGIYMNLPRKPWQYDPVNTQLYTLRGFISGPKDPANPSDLRFGNTYYPNRLKIPSVKTKLSGPLSGIILQQQWSVVLYNDDGLFDDPEENNFFNTPGRLLKSTTPNPTIYDFTPIRSGYASPATVSFTEIKLTYNDILRALTEEVCDTYTTTEFTNCPDSVVGKNKPRLWGSVLGVTLYAIDSTDNTKYHAGDGVTAVSAVYDADGTSLAFSFSSATGIITESTGKAKTADVTGSADNMIGEMIIDIMVERSNIQYNAANWDTTEAEEYRTDSPGVDFYFTGGTVKKFISDLLKNDNAFLIQKNNGKLTLRKWGERYGTHTILATKITTSPKRTPQDSEKNYLTAVQISYQKNHKAGTFGKTYFDDSQADTIAEANNGKRYTLPLEVCLSNDTDVEALADSMLSRFGGIPEEIEIGVGVNTADMDLLDFVYLDIVINGRTFTTKNGWIVKAVDPGQDTLTLEADGVYRYYDAVLGYTGATDAILGYAAATDALLGVVDERVS